MDEPKWRIVGDRGPSDPWLAPEAVMPGVNDDELMVLSYGTVMPKRTADTFGKPRHPEVKTWGQYKAEQHLREQYERDRQESASRAKQRPIEDAIIAKLQQIADTYPESVFTPEGRTPDGIAGTAIRECMLGQIRMMREARDD